MLFIWNKEAKREWDDRANDWHEKSVYMWENGSRKDIIPFFKKYVPIGLVADVGCGDGYGSHLLHKHGYQVIGMDISEKMISFANKHQQDGLCFVKGDLVKPPFQQNQFIGMMAINVLEWVEDPLHVLHEVKKIVRPDGYACIGILGPTAQPRSSSHARLEGENVICNTMMPWEFEKLATDHGWLKVDEHYVYKRGVTQSHVKGLSSELKQALSFLTLFMLQNKK